MKITMLGTSGSGKTVYMSAMSELFFNGSVNGYTIANRENNYASTAFINKGFDEINSLYQNGRFPSGTSLSVVMPLELRFRGDHIIDIDWIDYRGGAIKELAHGIDNSQNSEILAALIASDVVMVFVDAAVLKVCNNIITARSRVGANEISQLLSFVSRKKHLDIMFLLTKADSSIIDIQKDLPSLKAKLEKVYSRLFSETDSDLSQFLVIPVGALGYGNVKTDYTWRTDDQGGRTLVFNNTVSDFEKMHTVNIASSFAYALLKCLDSESKHLNTQASILAKELETLKTNFGPVKNIIDILFNNSERRGRIFDLERIILESREEIMRLRPHRALLEQIARSSQ